MIDDADEFLYNAFEHYWGERHPEAKYPRATWFKRSNIWGDPGYEQPSIHHEWLTFKSGVALGTVRNISKSK